LVRTHQGAIRAFLRRLTRNAALADDLAQVSFLKAFEKRDRLKDMQAARAWLFQIAYNSFLDHVRKEGRRAELATQVIDDAPETPPSTGLSVDIERAMNSLSPECRAVVMLCLAHGFTHSEAAQATNLPLGTVKSHCARGKTKLQAFLSAYETAQ